MRAYNRRDFRSNIKLENLETLEDKHNYEYWAHQLGIIFNALGATQVVLNGYQSDEFARQVEKTPMSISPKSHFYCFFKQSENQS